MPLDVVGQTPWSARVPLDPQRPTGASSPEGTPGPGVRPTNLLLTCRRMTLGEPDASGRRRPVPVEGSEFALRCSTAIAAIGQSVERALAEREGLRVTAWGIAVEAQTLATNLPGVFAGGDAVLGADLAVGRGGGGQRGGGFHT